MPEEGKTLRDYITAYARRAKDDQFDKVVGVLGCDRDLLVEMCAADLGEENLNEFGRFDRLKKSVDVEKAAAYFERRDGAPVTRFKANMLAAGLLKNFVLNGGVEVE